MACHTVDAISISEIACQVALAKGDLRGIVRAREISQAAVANMKQHLAFALLYNALGVPVVAVDTFANFSCKGHDRRTDLRVPNSGNEPMSPTDNSSPASAAVSERLFARAVVLLALVLSSAVSATEPPVTLEYQSAFAGYRHFDAQAPALEWRQANDTIRDGADADAAASHSGHQPSPPTDDDHKDHRP